MAGVDFPAAHSMDTEWFAVDAEGNVGLFDSSEDGAVPNRAATLGGAAEPSFDAYTFYAGVAARRFAAGAWEHTDHDRSWCATQEAAERIFLVLAAAPEPFAALVRAAPDKVHVSLHVPRDAAQVIAWVNALDGAGLRSGVNVLVRRSRLAETHAAVAQLRAAGIANDRMVFLPLRGSLEDTPTPGEVANVAGGTPFQSMSCARSPRFVSVDADRRVAWCSYTTTRAPLEAPTYAALKVALDGLGLRPCWEAMPAAEVKLVQLRA
jgi:hypothetical protein